MIRVLVVDDSAVVRSLLSGELARFDDVEVVGVASDPFVARDQILRLQPDVVTLDIEMPRMDGLTFLSRLMRHHPVPVVIVSSLTPANSEAAIRALSLGAVDVVCKPGSTYTVPHVQGQLIRAIRSAAGTIVSRGFGVAPSTDEAAPLAMLAGLRTTRKLIAIGASTGGPRAIETVLTPMPANAPPIVLVQHMAAGFIAPFAKRLNRVCAIEVREARDGDVLINGLALVAPTGQHLLVQRSGAMVVARLKDGPPVQHQRPAADVLFQSVARTMGRNAVGVLLTGMGADGARGLCAMREAGAHTIAQDEATSVVFGMPREAIRLGAASVVLSLGRIATDALRSACQDESVAPA